jgi:hypothetical protein
MKDDKQSVTLRFPITVDGAEVDALVMRRPKVRDMLAVEKSAQPNAEKEIHLFANLCEVPPDSLYELDMSDYTKLQQTYQSFLSLTPAMLDAPLLQ